MRIEKILGLYNWEIKDLYLFLASFFVFFVLIFYSFSFISQEENYDRFMYPPKSVSVIDTNEDHSIEKNSAYKKIVSNKQQKEKDLERYREIIKQFKQKTLEQKQQSTTDAKVEYVYHPVGLEEYLMKNETTSFFSTIIFSQIFFGKELGFILELFQEKNEVRGKFKNNSIYLYSVQKMPVSELITVFIHELGHYIDIVYFEKGMISDVSDNFYNISWQSTKVLKPKQTLKNFVSGYAMTNKYEDFAETFIYYILHNKIFEEKAKRNEMLQKKYDFFTNYVFSNGEFKNTSFAENDEIKSYYWDITKISINLENFLAFLKKYV